MSRPWMPLYVADYLADTMHLNAAQSGAYLHLIMHYWQHGSLPDDDNKLSRIARMRIEDWRRHRGTIEAFFEAGWHHARIDSELHRAAEISSKRKDAALQKHSKCNAHAPTNAEQMHTQSQPQLQKKEEPSLREGGTLAQENVSREKIPKAKRARARTPIPDDWVPNDRDIAIAIERGFTTPQIDGMGAAFKNYHTAKGNLMASWPAAWVTWCDNEIKFQRSNGNGQGRPRAFQNDELSLSRATGRLQERVEREGITSFPPRPSLLPREREADIQLLPPRRGTGS